MSITTLNIGTRKSALALWQSNYVADLIKKIHPQIVTNLIIINTLGDSTQEKDLALPEIGGKGLFTAELEQALYEEKIDLAVHSLKDLPTEMDSRLVVAAVPERASTADVLISKGSKKLAEIAAGSVVGTSSLRRVSQLKRLRPDLEVLSIRGNVDTRIKKVEDTSSQYSATILAEAGLSRLGLQGKISDRLDILPAPGQGALAVQSRSSDPELLKILGMLNHTNSGLEVRAEREFLAGLNAGCSTPVAALAVISGSVLLFNGRVLSEDGKECIEIKEQVDTDMSKGFGYKMAEMALKKGADKILAGYGE